MKRYRFDLAVMAACSALLALFGWHVMEGPRSFAHRDRLHAQVAALEAELSLARDARLAFDKRVQLMRPESVDPDMLDELARQTLNYALPTDIVIPRAN